MKTLRSYLSLCLCCLFLSLLSQPVDYGPDVDNGLPLRFEAIDAEQGLPHKTVRTFFQDYLGFIWMGTPIGLVKYDGYQFQTYQYEVIDTITGTRQSKAIHINTIIEGTEGDLWIGRIYEGKKEPVLFRFERKTEKLIPYLMDLRQENTIIGTIRDMHIVGESIWINTGHLFRIPLSALKEIDQRSEIRPYELSVEESEEMGGLNIFRIYEDSKARIWISTKVGIFRWLPESDTFQHFPVIPPGEESDGRSLPVAHMEERTDGLFWLFPMTSSLLFVFNPEEASVKVWEEGQANPHQIYLRTTAGQIWMGRTVGNGGISIFDMNTAQIQQVNIRVAGKDFLPNARVLDMLEDHSGSIWIGTEFGPLLKFDPGKNQFHWLHFQPGSQNSLSHNAINQIKQDRSGQYWISTLGGGLNRWNREENTFAHFRVKPGNDQAPITDKLLGLEITSDGKIWFGEGFSVGCYDLSSQQFSHYRNKGYVWTVYEDRKQRIWLGGSGAILRCYDSQTDEFVNISVPHPNKDPSRQRYVTLDGFYEDSYGKLWIGTFNSQPVGFFRFDPETEQFEVFNMPEARSFCEDDDGHIWIGSHDGLYCYDLQEESFKRYGREEGLSNNIINTIQRDDNGLLWLGTDNGLSRFNPEKETFHNYFQSDGLRDNEFVMNSYKNRQGELFFTGWFGLVYFHPDSIQINAIPPKLAFTGVELFGEPLSIGKESPLEKHISLTRQIHLAHWQNDITLHYAALHYKNPEKNHYKVWLENYDDDWRSVANLRSANYTNLDPGSYIFHVRAVNSDGVWNEGGISLGIVIHSPWYWSSWSQLFYLFLTVGIILRVYRFQLNRRLTIVETKRLHELDEIKTNLYTNITHEFRTPLTVIQGITDQIQGHETEKTLIRRNSKQLLNLITQMLDLSKLEAGKMELNPIHGDILSFLRYVTESFHSLALNQKINLNFYADAETIEMDYDPDKILQILSNLISNAIKFTPEYGKVLVTAHRLPSNNLEIKIKDTGIGIPPQQLLHIFNRFYQVDARNTRRAEGTGIGLTLTKELVELMKGSIEANSKVGRGSVFLIRLPIANKASRAQPMKTSIDFRSEQLFPHVNQKSPATTERPQLLIVEDNEDVMHYLTGCLKNDYKLHYARNGREGIDQALEIIPDIIISDVMMPEKDGFELCATLKTDPRTDHIPIILLTAKANMDSKLEGLEYGADVYLTKPFHQQELDIHLQKLIALRQRLQAKYNQPKFNREKDAQREDAFVLKTRQLILDHLNDETFGIEELSAAVHLSSTHVYRKLKALTGKSTSHFIRQIRLQEAFKLLETTEKNVSEIAYAVGFKDLSYFSKLFSQHFGKSAREISKKSKARD